MMRFKNYTSILTSTQILASSAKNLLLIDIGLAIAFPTIVIPALRGLQPDKYPHESIQFTAEQATWYGEYDCCQWFSIPFGNIYWLL